MERQAQENPFLHDAIDGFDTIDSNHLSAIENLEKLVEKRLQQTQNKRFAIRWRTIAVAASFALLVGIGSLLFFQTNENETHVAETQENVLLDDEVLTAAVVQEAPVQEELLDMQPPVQPSEPPPPPPPPLLPPPPPPTAVTEVMEFDLVAEQIVEERVEMEERAEIAAAMPPSPPTRVAEESFAADVPTTVAQGRVLDEFGDPLPGVTIMLENSTIGTATNRDGNFSLSIPEQQDNDLLIAFLGFKPQRLRPERDMTVVMQEDTDMLDEVVVTAFGGVQRRESITDTDVPTTVVRGRVLDNFGDPLPGAIIMLENSTIGTTTNRDGNFSLSIPEQQDNDLLITFLGFEMQRLRPERDMTVVMWENRELFDEVIVTGFGRLRREVQCVQFGEEEFESLLKENISRHLCAEETLEIRLRFRIDADGVPTNIRIVRVNCEKIRQEVIDLLGNSPKWTRVNRNVRLNVRIRGE